MKREKLRLGDNVFVKPFASSGIIEEIRGSKVSVRLCNGEHCFVCKSDCLSLDLLWLDMQLIARGGVL